ncbi:MAG: hypothetical protein ABIV94_03305 [Acidimicrobiales bacterium]
MTLRCAAALVAVLALAACSGAPSGATASAQSGAPTVASVGTPASVPAGDAARASATVDGVVITEVSFNRELNAIGAVPGYLDAADRVRAQGAVTTRLASGAFDPGYVRSLLRRRVLFALVEHELQQRGITVTDTCTRAATDLLPSAFDGDADHGRAFLAAFPTTYRDQLVLWSAEVRELQAALSGLPCDTAEPSAQNIVGTAYATWLDATLPIAAITVDPAYGTWDPASGRILPPADVAPVPTAPSR